MTAIPRMPETWAPSITTRSGTVRLFRPPRKSPTPQARLAPSAQTAASKDLVRNRPCGRDGVELVRVVEHGRLRGPRGAAVVMDGDGVDDLGEHAPLEPAGM
jgi:hypothetical protein